MRGYGWLRGGQTRSVAVNTAYVQLKNPRDRLGCASNEETVRKAKDLGLVS